MIHNIIKSDILKSNESEIIIQQVNCANKMGAGLAKAIYTKYPFVKGQYHDFCNYHYYNHIPLLGRFQICTIPNCNRIIINVFGQQYYGRDNRRYTDYNALTIAFNNIALYFMDSDVTFAIPYGIGAGLGGGDINYIMDIISNSLGTFNVKYYMKQLHT